MKKVFLVANEKTSNMKKQKGVSMVSLVIMIVVMLILLGIVFISSNDSIKNAGKGIFIRELALVQQAANESKLDNQVEGSSEEIKFRGFYKSKIKNPPISFVSFSEEEIYGYVIDLEYVHTEDAERGHDYKRFAGDFESNIVEFGVDDVYICDKDGNLFYAKGWTTDEGTYYSANEVEGLGPVFVLIDKIIAGDAKSAVIRVEVKKSSSGDLSLKIGDVDATKVAISADGSVETFETTVYENKTYKLVAIEEKDGLIGRTTSSVDVTELDVVTFAMKYDANGGTNAPATQLKTENVIARLSTEIPERTGYTFLGWNENPSATIATYRPGGEYVFDREVTFFAIWNEGNVRTFKVTYNDNGGSNGPLPQEDLSGDYTISNVVPQREGYGFLGWSQDARATNADYLPGDTVTLTKNLTLYAIWSKGTYTVTVTVEPEGAGTVTGNVAKPDGVETYITTSANPGFIFSRWSVKSGGVNLTNSTSPTTSFIMPENNVEIVAKYDVGQLTVRYNANKGKGAPAEQSAKYGDSITITSSKPTRTGYDFIGWSLKADAQDATYHEGQTYVVNENVTFYAVWKRHIPKYTLKFNLNGGYGNINGDVGKFADIEKVQGATITIPVGGENEPYRKDYTFKGWSLGADLDEVVLKPGDGYSRDANIEIFAVWKDEVPPSIALAPKQEEGSTKVQIVATVFDEGGLEGYAWTTTNTEPTSWEVDGVNGNDLVVEKTINQKGDHYFWVKDLAGNINSQSMKAYEIKFDANGGINTPETQYQLENADLILTTEKPTKAGYSFLGWSTLATPGNTETDVNFKKGSKLNLNADITLTAVWGEAFFTLSSKTAETQIDGPSVEVTVTKGGYTGNISVSSADPEIATVTITDNIITIVPGTKIGDVIITVTEDNEGTTETILVTVTRGIRKLTLEKNTHTFEYGDPNEKIGFTYNGKTTNLSTISSNSEIATATASDKTLTIKPGNTGTATITLVLAQDDQYLEQTANVEVTITKKQIVVTPKSNQSKVYDGTAFTPTLEYTYTGNVGSETPAFTGELTREIGKDIGLYEITIGDLALKNDGDFKADNYYLTFSGTKVYFEITPKRITVPVAITPQQYDGTMKEGILEGEDYTRGGEYQKIEAGNYTAIATLNDTNNYVWDDTNTTTARNIKWEIVRYDLTSSDISVEPITSYVYTGNEITPIPVIKKGETTLVNGNDFTLTYANNIDVGTATVTITGKGNYTGTLTATFEITKATMRVDVSGYKGEFDNKAHSITVTPMWPSTGYTIYYSTTELITANYNTVGSTTKPTFTTTGSTKVYYYIIAPNFYDYSGSETVNITAKDLSGNITISGVVNKSYTGNPITQAITVKDNDRNVNLEEGKDYTVSYANNVLVGTATLTVTGQGNYTGTKSANFEILGDTVTITKNTEALVSELEITITRTLTPGKLQYKIDNGSWIDYTGVFKIVEDCTIYAQSIDNGNVLGTNQLVITNICEHDFTPATCLVGPTCRYCGEVNGEALGHDLTLERPETKFISKAATCTEKAQYFHICVRYDDCGAVGTTTYENGDALGHDFSAEIATSETLCTEATCTEKATYYYTCSRCGLKGTETFEYGDPLDHDFSAKVQTEKYWKSDATCTVAKTYYYACSRCDAIGTGTYTVDSPLGHDFSLEVINDNYLANAATCTMPAKYYYLCARDCCDRVKGTDTFTHGEALGHTFGDYVVVTEANCIETGSQRRTCIRCGSIEMAEIPVDSTNHIGAEIETITVQPTCIATGTKKVTCSECSGVIRYETIPMVGHNYSEPTCLDEGVCSVCGATTPALGHDWSAPEPPRVCNRCGLEENCDYTYNVEYKSSSGLDLGSTTVTNAYGTTNTITAPAKTGYKTPASQDVTWDTETKTITFTYTPTSYSVTINCNGGTGVISTSYTIETETFTLGTPTRDGYEFKGWTGSNGYTPQTTITIKKGSTGAKYYTANWEALEMVQAIYSADDKSLTFVKDLKQTVGGTYNNKTVTAVYTGFENTRYLSAFYFATDADFYDSKDYELKPTNLPWWSYAETIERVDVLLGSDGTKIAPTYTSGWFYDFKNCSVFNLENLDTSKVTDMSRMFMRAGYNKDSLTINGLSTWNVSNVTNMSGMFMYTGKDSGYEAGTTSTLITDVATYSIGDLSNWNTSKVTDMSYMFRYAGASTDSFNIGDLSNWTTTNVTNMTQMFEYSGASATTSGWYVGNLGNWNVAKVTNMRAMFKDAGHFANSFDTGNLDNWNVSNVTNMLRMFSWTGKGENDTVVTTWNIGNLSKWNTSKVTTMRHMFMYSAAQASSFNIGDIGGWDVSNVVDMYAMFNCTALYNATTWYIGKLDNWNVSNVTNMASMFSNSAHNVSTWDIGNLDNWNTSKVTLMSSMFANTGNNATTWNIGDIGNWNTNLVTDMEKMFYLSGVKTLNLNKWNNSNVTTMANMFTGAKYLEKVTIGANFEFKGDSPYLPTPNKTYINGADGKWYDIATGTGYTPASVPSKTAATYRAARYTYNVVYQSTSGVSLGSTTVTKAFDTTNTITAPAKTGYNTPAAQNVVWDSTTAKTITFKYSPTSYSVTIDCNGGSGVSSTNYNIETSTFTLGTPTREGYTFTGWTGSNGTTAQTSVSIAKGSTGNKNYTANWKANKLYLYNYGTQYTSITGGWLTKGMRGKYSYESKVAPTIDYNSDHMEIQMKDGNANGNSGIVYTKNKIDLTNYKYLVCEIAAVNSNSDMNIIVIDGDGVDDYYEENSVARKWIPRDVSSEIITYKLDISSITGSNYNVGFAKVDWTPDGTFKIYSVYLTN